MMIILLEKLEYLIKIINYRDLVLRMEFLFNKETLIMEISLDMLQEIGLFRKLENYLKPNIEKVFFIKITLFC